MNKSFAYYVVRGAYELSNANDVYRGQEWLMVGDVSNAPVDREVSARVRAAAIELAIAKWKSRESAGGVAFFSVAEVYVTPDAAPGEKYEFYNLFGVGWVLLEPAVPDLDYDMR